MIVLTWRLCSRAAWASVLPAATSRTTWSLNSLVKRRRCRDMNGSFRSGYHSLTQCLILGVHSKPFGTLIDSQTLLRPKYQPQDLRILGEPLRLWRVTVIVSGCQYGF